MYYLRHTWKECFDAGILHELDVSINNLDKNWPIIENSFPDNHSTLAEDEFNKKSDIDLPIERKCANVNESDKYFVVRNKKLPLNIMASACLGVHQFLTLAYAAEQECEMRSPQSQYFSERRSKGRFAVCVCIFSLIYK